MAVTIEGTTNSETKFSQLVYNFRIRLRRLTFYKIFYNTLTFAIPNIILYKLGYKNRRTRTQFREKLAYFVLFLVLNAAISVLVFNPNQPTNTPLASKTLSEWNQLSQSYIAISGNLYERSFIPVKITVPESTLLDYSFLLQNRSEFCDSFWSAHGSGTYLPCLSINFNTSALIQFDKDNDVNPCKLKEGDRNKVLSSKKFRLRFSHDDVEENPYFVIYKNQVIDLTRLRYLHPNLIDGEKLWFTSLSKLIYKNLLEIEGKSGGRGGNRDIDFMLHNLLTPQQKEEFETCVLPTFRIAYLAPYSYLYTLANAIHTLAAFYFMVWALLVLSVVLLHRTFNYHFGEWFKRTRFHSSTLNISKHLFRQRFQRHLNSDLRPQFLPVSNSLTKKDTVDNLVDNNSIPNTVRFDSSEMVRGVYHLAQSEPDYELMDALNFEPLRTAIVIPFSGDGPLHHLNSTLASVASTRYPATHKLLLVVVDGSCDLEFISQLLTEVTLPERDTSYTPYQPLDPNLSCGKCKVLAGYYEYDNPDYDPGRLDEDPNLSRKLKVPTVVVHKLANSRTRNGYGARDSLALSVLFFHRTFFNLKLTPLDYDMFILIKTITGVNPSTFNVLVTVTVGATIVPKALIKLIKPLTQYRDVMCVTTPIAYQCSNLPSQLLRVTLNLLQSLCTPASILLNEPLTFSRECTAYRMSLNPKFNNSFLDVDVNFNFKHQTQPVLLHPDVIQKFTQRSTNLLDSLWFDWLPSGYLTKVLTDRFRRYRAMQLLDPQASLLIPSGFDSLLKFTTVTYVTWTVHLLQLLVARASSLSLVLLVVPPLVVLVCSPGILVGMLALVCKLAQADLIYNYVNWYLLVYPFGWLLLIIYVSFNQPFLTTKDQIYDVLAPFLFAPILGTILPVIGMWNLDFLAGSVKKSLHYPSFLVTSSRLNGQRPGLDKGISNPNFHQRLRMELEPVHRPGANTISNTMANRSSMYPSIQPAQIQTAATSISNKRTESFLDTRFVFTKTPQLYFNLWQGLATRFRNQIPSIMPLPNSGINPPRSDSYPLEVEPTNYLPSLTVTRPPPPIPRQPLPTDSIIHAEQLHHHLTSKYPPPPFRPNPSPPSPNYPYDHIINEGATVPQPPSEPRGELQFYRIPESHPNSSHNSQRSSNHLDFPANLRPPPSKQGWI